jgi:hypothetical protein
MQMQDAPVGPGVEVGIPLVFMAGMFIISIAIVAFWIWMLIDCLTKEPTGSNEKVLWAVLIVVLGCFGAAAYFIFRRGARIRETGR